MNEIIRLEDFHKDYRLGDGTLVHALNGVTFSIKEGEMVSIIGDSGSGKSTLMNCLGCLDFSSRGKYYLKGKDVLQFTANELADVRNRQIGFIFQGFNLISGLTAVENVELPLLYRGLPKEIRRQIAVGALAQVGLSDRMKHLPAQLSGGQQQRTAIARTIAARPPLILADEPTGNLDKKTGREILHILKQCNHMGTTVVLITHDPEIAASTARTITISNGKIVKDRRNHVSVP